MPEEILSSTPPSAIYATVRPQADSLIAKLVEICPLFDKAAKGDEDTAFGLLASKLDKDMGPDEAVIALAAAIRQLYALTKE